MLTMATFHKLLFSNEGKKEGYLARLVELTRSSLEQVRRLKSGSEWDVWHAETA